MTDEFEPEDRRAYVTDPEKGLKLDDSYFRNTSSNDRIKIMSPALFFGIMLLVVISGFGLYFVNTFGQ